MGRKKKNNKVKELIVLSALILIIIIADKTGVLKYIDDYVRNSEFANQIRTVENSNISTAAKVKIDEQIVESVSKNISIEKGKLNILFFDVGQADSELIIYDNKTMLIDAGNTKDGEKIVNAIKTLGISKLDYVIGTHVHEDHIGGMSFIIDNFEIGEFYLPYNTQTTSSYYKNLLKSLANKNLSINETVIGDKIELSNIICEVMSVRNDEPENANESSIVLELTYGNKKYLFMGDAETNNEEERTWNDVDVLKVGHHGSNTSSSINFLNQVSPEIAIISVGAENSYGLPKEKIIDRLKKIGTEIYRTDLDGTIQIISDGNNQELRKIDISLDGNK